MSSSYEHDEIEQGLALKWAGRDAEAEGILKAVLAKNPKNERARIELTRFLSDSHAKEALLQEGIKAGYPSSSLRTFLAELLMKRGDFEQALDLINELDSRSLGTYLALIRLHGLKHADCVVPTASTLSVGRPIQNAVQVSMVKDEDDIIHVQLKRHYDLGFRNFAIADNASKDRTAERIHEFRAKHTDARVLYVFDPVVGYTQAIKTTALARYAADFFRSDGVDVKWIFPLDADEFISMPAEGNDLLSLLQHLEQGNQKIIAYFQCDASPPGIVETIEGGVNVPDRFSIRLHYRHRLQPKVAYKFDPAAELEMGNHFCYKLIESASQIFHASLLGIYLCHLPYRSLKQVKSKILNGGLALAAAPSVGGGRHWRVHYERYKAEGDSYVRHVVSDFIKKSPHVNQHFDHFDHAYTVVARKKNIHPLALKANKYKTGLLEIIPAEFFVCYLAKNMLFSRQCVTVSGHCANPIIVGLAIYMMMPPLARLRMRHGDYLSIGKRLQIVIYLVRGYMLGHFATPYQIHRHDVWAAQQVMKCNWIYCLLNIREKSIYAMRIYAMLCKETDCVPFTAADI